MSNQENAEAAIYVGTYGKYTAGSIAGKWLKLDDYADGHAFIEACHELHSDESDPELMFQDFENIPKKFVCESGIDLVSVYEWLNLTEQEKEIVALYWNEISDTRDADVILDSYHGSYDSEIDHAWECFENMIGALNEKSDEITQQLIDYFDIEKYQRNIRYDFNYIRSDSQTHVFWMHL
jgi:antirestriction protein